MSEGKPERTFRRHKYLDYKGYAFPWYATVIWISFFIGGLIYFVRFVAWKMSSITRFPETIPTTCTVLEGLDVPVSQEML